MAIVLQAFSAMNSGFGLDAFNRSVSAVTRGNAVFSPLSFEFDCVIFSEAFGALVRSKFAETMGVLNGLDGVYCPLYDELSAVDDPTFKFLAARAFCLPDERKANSAYRQWLQTAFSGEAFSFDFKKGAECWFRARMDGDMEDFSIHDKAATVGHYSYYDLLSVSCAWQCASVSNASDAVQFHISDESVRPLPAVTGLCNVDTWKRKPCTVYRFLLAKGMWFYAIVPKEGQIVRDIRAELSSSTIVDLINGIKSITEPDIQHGPCQLTIPMMDITTDSDLKLPFGYFHFPMTGMERLEPAIQPSYVRQLIRFRLVPDGVAAAPANDRPPTNTTCALALDKPFLFFVFHEKTQAVPVAGQFMGQ